MKRVVTYQGLHYRIKKAGYVKGQYILSEGSNRIAFIRCTDLETMVAKLKSVGVESAIVTEPAKPQFDWPEITRIHVPILTSLSNVCPNVCICGACPKKDE